MILVDPEEFLVLFETERKLLKIWVAIVQALELQEDIESCYEVTTNNSGLRNGSNGAFSYSST